MPVDRSVIRQAAALAALSLLIRIIVIHLLPPHAVSTDVTHWEAVAATLDRGENPYRVTAFLNWPPFWMQTIWLLDKVADATSIRLADVIRYFVSAVDSLNVALTFLIASRFFASAAARAVVTTGMALNPVALFLVCQHANFDSLVVTALLLFAMALLRFRERGDPIDWLSAAFALGMGILVKTVPLLLSGILAHRALALPRRTRVLGALLVLVPAAIGVGVIYVLAPDAVLRNVIRYRSMAGWFGVTGLLQLAGLPRVVSLYAALFPIVALSSIVFIGRRVARRPLSAGQIALMIGVVLLSIITLGPGYATQYIAWPLPFFVLSVLAFDREWRRDVIVVWIVAIATYFVEYGMTADGGWFVVALFPAEPIRHAADILSEDGVKTLFRLPLFAGYLWLIATAIPRLRAAPENV